MKDVMCRVSPGRMRGRTVAPNDYRVLCKNGSLASFTGFLVDHQCALSVTIDSEVIMGFFTRIIS